MSRFICIDDVLKDERTVFFKDLLPEGLNGSRGYRLIGAVDDEGFPEGVVAFTVNGNIVDILHLEVYPKLRRNGIGTALTDMLLQYLSLTEMPFMVQAAYSVDGSDEDKVTDSFFKSLDAFEVVSGGRYCTVTPDTLRDPSREKLISSYECSVVPYTELSRAERNRFMEDMEEKNLGAFLDGNFGKVIPELSLCHMEEDRCTVCVIFRESVLPDTVELSFLMSDRDSIDRLIGVLNEVTERHKKLYPGYDIVFSLVNTESELIAKRIFKKDMQISEIYTAVSFGEV